MAIKTFKDALKRPCFKCSVTGALVQSAFLYDDKVFATPFVAWYFFSYLCPKLSEDARKAHLEAVVSNSQLELYFDIKIGKGYDGLHILQIDQSLCKGKMPSIPEYGFDTSCLVSAADFEEIVPDAEEEFDSAPKKKVLGYVYKLMREEIAPTVVCQGDDLNDYLPPALWYMGESILVHKNKDIPVRVYVSQDDNYKNELFLKYFGKELVGDVYLHSQQQLPMMESNSLALDKAMESEEVKDQIKANKKKARVPRKKIEKLTSDVISSEVGSAEEAKAVEALQEATKAKKKANPRKRISGEVVAAKEKKPRSKKSKVQEDPPVLSIDDASEVLASDPSEEAVSAVAALFVESEKKAAAKKAKKPLTEEQKVKAAAARAARSLKKKASASTSISSEDGEKE